MVGIGLRLLVQGMAPSGRNKTTQNNDSDSSEQNGTQTQDTNQNVQETGVRKLVSLRRHHEMEINTLIDMLENNIYEEEDDLELINETFTELSQFQQKLDTLNDQMLQAGSEHDFEEHSHWTVQLKQKIRVFSMKVKKYLKKQVSNPATSTIPNNSAQENATSIFPQETATSMPTANIMDIPNNNLITMSNNTQGNASQLPFKATNHFQIHLLVMFLTTAHNKLVLQTLLTTTIELWQLIQATLLLHSVDQCQN